MLVGFFLLLKLLLAWVLLDGLDLGHGKFRDEKLERRVGGGREAHGVVPCYLNLGDLWGAGERIKGKPNFGAWGYIRGVGVDSCNGRESGEQVGAEFVEGFARVEFLDGVSVYVVFDREGGSELVDVGEGVWWRHSCSADCLRVRWMHGGYYEVENVS